MPRKVTPCGGHAPPPPHPHMDSECASGCTGSTARATAPSPGRPTPGVVKQDKSSGGSIDTTKTRSGPQRVRMCSGERPIGAAKGKQSDTEALCQPPPPPLPTPFSSVAWLLRRNRRFTFRRVANPVFWWGQPLLYLRWPQTGGVLVWSGAFFGLMDDQWRTDMWTVDGEDRRVVGTLPLGGGGGALVGWWVGQRLKVSLCTENRPKSPAS